jgi:hypothetical protein
MLFAHGFGCDQNMWRFMVPIFEEDYKVVLFDHVGPAARTSVPKTVKNIAVSTATRATSSSSVRSLTSRRRLGWALRQCDDRRPRGKARPLTVGRLDSGRPVSSLHQRRRLRRRLRTPRHRSCWIRSTATTWVVERHGTGEHGKRGAPGTRGRACQQLLANRPDDRESVRSRDVSLR